MLLKNIMLNFMPIMFEQYIYTKPYYACTDSAHAFMYYAEDFLKGLYSNATIFGSIHNLIRLLHTA